MGKTEIAINKRGRDFWIHDITEKKHRTKKNSNLTSISYFMKTPKNRKKTY